MTPNALAQLPLKALEAGYPRPQLVRQSWLDLAGAWAFSYDDDRVGLDDGWAAAPRFDRRIIVPFPPESKASGITDTGFHPIVWYQREISAEQLRHAGRDAQGSRMLLHFGAVDYRCDVWIDGRHLGSHVGGQTPFAFDITAEVQGAGPWSLVVRAEDDPRDVGQPRGKQDWQLEPHGIWYHRTTGIWQPVWLEAVPDVHIDALTWSCDLAAGSVQLDLELNTRPSKPVRVEVQLSHGGAVLAEVGLVQAEPRSRTVLALPRQSNGQAERELFWSPDSPQLIDAVITVTPADTPADTPDDTVDDTVASYLGLRSLGWADGHLLINDRPRYLRSVLAQGYWPETLLAAPSADALRAEVQLIKDLGFNGTRVHEKAEDPRFLAWADRLGLLVWAETASAYEFSPVAVERSIREWIDIVRRDTSHPCVVAWVPLNESWGVQHIAHDPAQLAYAQSLYHLTKALDPTRPVISNDGWEHAVSDLWTIHDYGITRNELAVNYTDRPTVRELMAGVGPLGRRMQLIDPTDHGQPAVVSEFGGISYAPTGVNYAWGYVTAADAAEFETMLREIFAGLQSSPVLAGFCYTQLTDTLQETNGLTDPHRRPKLPASVLRSIVLGDAVDVSGHRRPRQAVEQSHRLVSERAQHQDEEAHQQTS